MSIRSYAAALAATLLVAGTAQAQPNLVANGSFEVPAIGGNFSTYGAGNMSITGWTISAGSVDLIHSYWNASNGMQSLDMNGNTPGTILQMVATQAGGTYNLSFDLAGNPDGAFDKQLAVYWGGSLVGGTNVTFNQTGSRAAMGWTTVSFTGLTATSGTTELRFSGIDTGHGAMGAALDNVALVTSTPEPATYMLMGSGLLVLAGVARRRNA